MPKRTNAGRARVVKPGVRRAVRGAVRGERAADVGSLRSGGPGASIIELQKLVGNSVTRSVVAERFGSMPGRSCSPNIGTADRLAVQRQNDEWAFPRDRAKKAKSKQADPTLQVEGTTAGKPGEVPEDVRAVFAHVKALLADPQRVLYYLKRLNTAMIESGEKNPDFQLESALAASENVAKFKATKDVLTDILTAGQFYQQLRTGELFHDPNVSPRHGAETHRIQWYCISQDYEQNSEAYGGLTPPLLFEALGVTETRGVKAGNEEAEGYWRQLVDESNEADGASGNQPEVFTTFVLDNADLLETLVQTTDYQMRMKYEEILAGADGKADDKAVADFKEEYVKTMTSTCVGMALKSAGKDDNVMNRSLIGAKILKGATRFIEAAQKEKVLGLAEVLARRE